jgi:trans-2-enoyl-CoA reductase
LSSCFVDRKVAGSEGWGLVTAIRSGGGGGGDDCSLKVGDYVVPGQPGLGTCRSCAWWPAEAVIQLERGRELWDAVGGAAAAAPLFQTGGTALRLLRDFVTLEPGDVVVQNAGNSAVGYMASQLAANMGLHPVGLVRRGKRSPEQFADLVEYLMKHGKNSLVVADDDVAANEKDVRITFDSLRDLSNQPPRLASNAVGGASAGLLLQVLGPGGTMVTYGGMSTQPVTVPTGHLIFEDIKLAGYWQSRWMAQQSSAEQRTRMMNKLVDSVLDGKLKCPPVISFPLSDYKAVFECEAQQSGETIRSKIVFDCIET